MNFRILVQLVVLGMIWGSSFLFQRITVPALGAGATASARILLAVLVLGITLAVMRRPLHWRSRWRDYVGVGLINSGIPFLLFAFAAYSLPAGYIAVLNATVPLFTVLIGWIGGPRPSNSKLTGVVVGILGVATLARFGTVTPSWMTVAGFAAVLVASILYALGARAVRVRFADADPLTVACGTMSGALLPLLPVALYTMPGRVPSVGVSGALLALGVVCTGLAYAIFYQLIREAGSERAVTVTFLVPLFALVWGALFLGEAITWASAVGCGLVLFAVALIFERVPGLRPRVIVAPLPQLCAQGGRR
ncbi:MAG: DMT family transporter [Rudaea sp.]|nr:DMT family transporter [Rudaea sp.]